MDKDSNALLYHAIRLEWIVFFYGIFKTISESKYEYVKVGYFSHFCRNVHEPCLLFLSSQSTDHAPAIQI